MFTGIIETIGIIKNIQKDQDLIRFTVVAPALAPEQKNGNSVAIDGVCYTVVTFDQETFTVEAMPETYKRTILRSYKEGTKVNLELPLKIGDRLHGHFVQGHVDTMAEILDIMSSGASKQLKVSLPIAIKKLVVFKGSITINGVSLTISTLTHDAFEVSLIPITLAQTNLGLLQQGDWVNLEVDILGRYLVNTLNET